MYISYYQHNKVLWWFNYSSNRIWLGNGTDSEKRLFQLSKKQPSTVEETGLFVSKEFPFLGASPHGVVYCTCHGRGLLAIKCPSNQKVA